MKYAEELWKQKFPTAKATFEQGHVVYDLVTLHLIFWPFYTDSMQTLQRLCEFRSGLARKAAAFAEASIKATFAEEDGSLNWDLIASEIEGAIAPPYPFIHERVKYYENSDKPVKCVRLFLALRAYANFCVRLADTLTESYSVSSPSTSKHLAIHLTITPIRILLGHWHLPLLRQVSLLLLMGL
jgi:hypothetical protein